MRLSLGRVAPVSSRLALVLPVVLVVLAPVALSPTVAAADYGLEATSGVDTPDRTVTLGGREFQVDSVGRVAAGESVTAAVTAPADEQVDVYLYNSEREILAVRSATSNGSVTFATDGRRPGTYLLALVSESGTAETILPVVVAGWNASPAVSTARDGANTTVRVALDRLVSMPRPASVTVVLSHQGTVVDQYDARRIGNGRYEVSLPADRATDAYAVYAAVRNGTTVAGRQELVGLSETYDLGTAGTPTVTTAPPPEPIDTETSASPSTPPSPTAGSPGPSDGLLTASSPTFTATPTASTSVPGLGLLAAVLSLAVGSLLLGRREAD